jgi:hypothetical protein
MKTAMNEIMELEAPFQARGDPVDDATKAKIASLEAVRQRAVNEVLLIKNLYLGIDSKFESELESHRKSFGRCFDPCGWLKS